jgi:hypothetical protein
MLRQVLNGMVENLARIEQGLEFLVHVILKLC